MLGLTACVSWACSAAPERPRATNSQGATSFGGNSGNPGDGPALLQIDSLVGPVTEGIVGVEMSDAPALDVGGSRAAAAATRGWIAVDVDEPYSFRTLWLLAADGSCRIPLSSRKGREKQPALSPDGRRLAYASDESGPFQIHVRDLATGHVRRVTDLADGATYPAWSPDGTRLAFVDGDRERRSSFGSSVLVMNLETAQTRVFHLTAWDLASYYAPVFLGNDTLLLGNGSLDIRKVSLRDGGMQSILPLPVDDWPVPSDPSVGPDPTRFVYSDEHCGPSRIFVASVDGFAGDPCLGAQALDTGAAVAPSNPAWGPSGFVAVETATDLFLAREGGTAPEPATWLRAPTGRAYNPSWAPADFALECSADAKP